LGTALCRAGTAWDGGKFLAQSVETAVPAVETAVPARRGRHAGSETSE